MGCVHEEREQIAEYVHEESQDGFAHDLEAHAEEVAAIFKALSSHKRLLIVCSLLDGPRSVAHIAEYVPGISLPAVSQHLSALKAAGVLSCEKQGQHVLYSLADARVKRLIGQVRQDFCGEGER